MEKAEMYEELKSKKELDYYTKLVYEDNSFIPYLLEIEETDKTAVKYQAEKIIRKISEDQPKLIYPYFNRIAALLNSPNNFIKWGAVLTVPNLLSVDVAHQWNAVREKYLNSFQSQQMAEFGNAVKSVQKIIAAYPDEEKSIIPILLGIDKHTFLHHGEVSQDCLNVAIGHIIDCFSDLYPSSSYQPEMELFVKENKDNDRKQVQTKAKKFIKKYLL